MVKIGVVGTKGGWSSELLADAAAQRTGHRLLIDMAEVGIDLDSGRALYGDVDLSELDALIIKKVGARYSPDLMDRLEMLRFLNDRGLKMFSPPARIMGLLDRLSCTVTLRLGGIPMPPTTITESVETALAAVADYGEAVFKPLYTSKARGMKVIRPGPSARAEIDAYKSENALLYIQQKIDLPGQDLGVVFLGGQYLTTYARHNEASVSNGQAWNTTTRSGGRYKPHAPSPEIVSLARQAQDLFKLDFTCVDVVETADGPKVFEVSAFGGFRGIQTVSDIDPAGRYVDYVMERIGS